MSALINSANGNLDEESLITFLCEVASLISKNFSPISPSNFLTMKPSIVLAPPGKFSDDDLYHQ